jgi:hypothetical protein
MAHCVDTPMLNRVWVEQAYRHEENSVRMMDTMTHNMTLYDKGYVTRQQPIPNTPVKQKKETKRLFMGYRSDCLKCVQHTPGHTMHWVDIK